MTPQEFEPVGYWMGWSKDKMSNDPLLGESWVGPFVRGQWLATHGEVADKTSLTSSECIEALNRLVEKGYVVALDHKGTHWWMFVRAMPSECMYEATAPTINQAVEQAILKLIEAERGSSDGP